MDFEFRLLEFFPKAQKEFIFTGRKKDSDKTVKAILVEHEGQRVWLGQNSHIKFFKEDRVYALSYVNKTKKLNFDLKLLDFRIKKYQGSEKAKEYESVVEILDSEALDNNESESKKSETKYSSNESPTSENSSNESSSGDSLASDKSSEENLSYGESFGKKTLISMNEPLKYRGWTFYQASFVAPETPEGPYRSILSVNYDPGRYLKYIGSSWIVLGVILLVYRRRLFKIL